LVHPAAEFEPDSALVRAVREGDPGAAGKLYDRHVASVQALVYRLIGRQSDLEDIVQEVFIHGLTSIDKLREPSALRSWLLGIAVGKVRSYLRARWRRRWLSFVPEHELPEPEASDDERQSELARAVSAVLERLPAEERIALVVHRLQGLSIQESAEVCGMSLSTFKRRYASGESRFLIHARHEPALEPWLSGSSA
jgi:RNA polymerase sigma-70 factor (ECF subfamily)